MHLQTLTLTNYRGAKALTLALDSQLNVFVGANGAGKSTVLDAATILLSWAVNRIMTPGASGRPIAESDITNGKDSSIVELTGRHNNKDITWRLAKARKGTRPSDRPTTHLKPLTQYTEQIQSQLSDEAAALPLFVYYPVNRAVFEIPLRTRSQSNFEIFAAYNKALTSDTDFRSFFEWFRAREDLENELKILGMEGATLKAQKVQEEPDPQLEAVRSAIHQLLPEFTNIRVRRSPLRMEIEKNGQLLTVNQLSDGEKCLIAMVSDLARRLAIANPSAENPLAGEGIVLIDEIDLHLHPKWQRIVVPRLLKIFPNCQFLVSTHSPHVLTHVKPNNIFLLRWEAENITAGKPAQSYGQTANRILEDLMGLETTRPRSISSELHSVYEMIDRNHLDEARAEIASIRQKMGEDPDLIKADVLIRRKELINR
ncbi:MAG: AAA family ATPase [Cyanobacteria bacterium J06634_6]